MKAVNKEDIHGCMTGRPLIAVELDKQAFALLLDRSRQGIASDWVLLGRAKSTMVRIGHTNPEDLIRVVDDERDYPSTSHSQMKNDEVFIQPYRSMNTHSPKNSMTEAFIDAVDRGVFPHLRTQ